MRWRRRRIGLLGIGVACALAATTVAPAGAATGRGRDAGLRPVGVVVRAFTDRSRRTPADPPAAITPSARRVLPTTIYYPARGDAAPGALTPAAKPARRSFPLVLFAPGAPGTPEDYERLLVDWAAHGYVVAGIEFPVSSVAGPDDVAWEDLPAQTDDAEFVLDRVLALDPDKVGIPGIDEDRVAVAGHSFGGATALSLVSKCCRDDRLDAVVLLAPKTRTEDGPRLEKPSGPVLFVHARKDRAVPYRESARKCAATRSPKRLLTVEEIRGLRAHVVPFVGADDAYSAVVRPAIVDFLDGWVRNRRSARARFDATGADATGADPELAVVTRCRPEATSASAKPTG